MSDTIYPLIRSNQLLLNHLLTPLLPDVNLGDVAMGNTKKPQLLGRYIVADPEICHGEPTFRGTRIMVWQVLEMVARGMAWETIIEECHNSITKEAIAEAVKLSGEAFLKHADEFVLEPALA